jgi:hypothetical protein
MPPLVKRDKIAALEITTTVGDGFEVTGLWFFLQLPHQCACGNILHAIGQLAKAIDGFIK